MKNALFCELPIGARFEFRGRRYEKLALSMAGDEERCGHAFHGVTEVLPAEGVTLVRLEHFK